MGPCLQREILISFCQLADERIGIPEQEEAWYAPAGTDFSIKGKVKKHAKDFFDKALYPKKFKPRFVKICMLTSQK